jgi:hypothetical protein
VEHRGSVRVLVTGLLTVGLFELFGGGARRADAVPVFSRKYRTSCQTCHVIFPKLNPFGEAFRLNGYRLPGETEDQVKQTPVSLGAEAYEKLWPQMVYPSTLPGNVPFALNVKFADLYQSTSDDSGHAVVHNDFQFPQEANLFAAGTLGKHYSFFGEFTYEELPDGGSDVEIEHARFDIISPFGPDHLFNFRIGKLAPNAWDGFQEMWIMTDNGIDSLFNYNPIGFNGGTGTADEGGGIGLPARARAIEMYGVAMHRLFYTVGVDSPIGVGPGGPSDSFASSSKKDFYARVDYKFGGMGLDGDTTGVTLPPENWKETSFRVGLFGYWGDGTGINFEVEGPEGDTFNQQDVGYARGGVYGSLLLGNLNLFGAAVHGTDKLETFDPASSALLRTQHTSWDAWFVQADYVFVPPFQASVRYENLRPGDPEVEVAKTLNVNLSYLIAANIKLMAEYRQDLRSSLNYQMAAILRAAF